MVTVVLGVTPPREEKFGQGGFVPSAPSVPQTRPVKKSISRCKMPLQAWVGGDKDRSVF